MVPLTGGSLPTPEPTPHSVSTVLQAICKLDASSTSSEKLLLPAEARLNFSAALRLPWVVLRLLRLYLPPSCLHCNLWSTEQKLLSDPLQDSLTSPLILLLMISLLERQFLYVQIFITLCLFP